ncbi:MAG TPA: cytochrome c [Bryobacteraceae bacterium]|nr:cytochrome c [Bryobacteraceae bacterium]
MWKLSGALVVVCAGALAATPAQVERGQYIFKIADCSGCHSERDFSRFAGPVVAGGTGKGMVFPPELGLPGKVVAPNITPDRETGIGAWSDQEKIRAIRDGVGRDGKVLFPMMPSHFYRAMSDRDVDSLVAYMNTLAPVKNSLPRTALPPGLQLPLPQAAGKVPHPDKADRVKYGKYLVTIAACADCHTPMGPQGLDTTKMFAGGREFNFPGGMRSVSANLTPDPETGIGKWTEDQFVKRFRIYEPYLKAGAPKVEPHAFTIMPWLMLADADEEDLRAMYAYLRSIPAVKATHRGDAQQVTD